MTETIMGTDTSIPEYTPIDIKAMKTYEENATRYCDMRFDIIGWVGGKETITHQEINEYEIICGSAITVFGFGIPIPNNILAFCILENIPYEYIIRAVKYANDNFRALEGWYLGIEEDPETGDKWITLDVDVSCSEEDALMDYDKYLDSWITIPYPERSKIVLVLNVL